MKGFDNKKGIIITERLLEGKFDGGWYALSRLSVPVEKASNWVNEI